MDYLSANAMPWLAASQRKLRESFAAGRMPHSLLLISQPGLGALPLALGTGTGAEMRRPLGITIVGGLIFSQALTLFTTPVVYLYLDRLQTRIQRRKLRAVAAHTPASAHSD